MIEVGDKVRVLTTGGEWGHAFEEGQKVTVTRVTDHAVEAEGISRNTGLTTGQSIPNGEWEPIVPAVVEEPEIGTFIPKGVARHGHPRFYAITAEEEDLHDRKNHDYAAGGDPLGNFKRVASILGMYPGLDLNDPAIVAMVYAMKQVDAYLWIKSNGHAPKVEGLSDRLQDVSVYAKLTRIIEEDRATAQA